MNFVPNMGTWVRGSQWCNRLQEGGGPINMFTPTNHLKRALSVGLAACLVVLATAIPGMAQVAPSLGTAESFGVLAATTVTNTGPTVVDGDLGVFPGTAVTGFPPGTVTGEIHAGDPVAAQAQADARAAYLALQAQPCTTIPTELGGQTLTPGVYCSESGTFENSGTLTLDAQGDPNAVFIFQTDSTLVTASGSSVDLVNGAQACNVFFAVGSSATLGTNSTFAGTIIALTSITLTTGADLEGRALALNGAVTMDTNNVSVPSCEQPTPPVPGSDPAPAQQPEVCPAASLESEQEAQSGELGLSGGVGNSGDYAGQTVTPLQFGDTGSLQNTPGVLQNCGSEAGDIEPSGISKEISPELETASNREVGQSSGANGE